MPERETGGSTTEELLAERYGAPSPVHRRALVALLVVIVAAGAGWLGWAAWSQANPDVRGELRSFEVDSDHEVTVVIDIDRTDGAAVVCTVRALAEDHAIVADQEVTLPAGDDGSARLTLTVPTERRATTAMVTDCRQ